MKPFLRKALYNFLTFFMDREKLIFLLGNKEEHALLGFKRSGYLYDIGWVNSIITDSIVDNANNPLPWVTYPFIKFIENRLHQKLDVFEYGSGNSTLYYSKYVGSVDSVESDLFWYDKIKNTMPGNVNLFYCELTDDDGAYCRYANQTNKSYDLIIVDGGDRVNCCKQSIGTLKAEGVLVLDDSERTEYAEAIDFLLNGGFKKIDFWGIAPSVNYLKCTTIFYRNNNCLGI
ncbi:MAG TPA: hypothetical protein VK671_02360 [Mucilaginibacter sp.]|jgi:hypothetical protein|nr:hypothetical protein [Mucilaginibacter sp.]